jgi:hypothetical protein
VPNFDLGTARGRIKLDADTRGATSADRALGAFERTVKSITGRVNKFDSTLNQMESELRQVTGDFKRADSAAKEFDRDVKNMDGSIKRNRASTVQWNRDLRELHDRLRGVSDAAATFIPATAQAVRFVQAFRNTGDLKAFSANLNLAQRSLRSFVSVGGVGIVFDMIRSKFFGMGKALQSVTGWQRQVVQFASSFASFSFIAGTLGTLAVRTGLFAKAVGGLTNVMAPLDYALRGVYQHASRLSAPLKLAGRNLSDLWKNTDLTANSVIRFIGGAALMRTSLQSLGQRFAILNRLPPIFKAVLVGAMTAGEAAVQLMSKALVGLSNLLVGLLDGAKQLAGGLLAIPGAIAMGVAAFGTLKLITSGIKANFKDILKADDAKKMAEALDKLPVALKPFGQALADVAPKWKALRDAATATFLSGGDKQLRAISDNYLPKMQSGVLQVANSWKYAKDQVVGFLSQAQTQGDLSKIFMNTSQTMNQFSNSIQPALQGLRDIAAVGSDFLRELSAGIPSLSEKFAAWAKTNRENGNLMQWMKDSWKGVKDLTNGMLDLIQATWKLLTMFKTKDNNNFLESFANSMQKFNDTVTKSLSGGALKRFADGVKGMGDDKLRQVIDMLKSLGEAFLNVLPFLRQVSDAFSSVFYPAVKFVLGVIVAISKALNEIGGGAVIGTILGLVAAWKLLGVVIGPVWDIMKLIFGFTQFKRGAQGIILGLSGALENLGGVGKRASGALMSVGDSVTGFVSKLGIAAVAVGALWMAWSEGERQINDIQRSMDDAAKHASEFKGKLSSAFLADRGFTGKNVFDTVKTQTDTMLTDLKATGDQVPGILANIRGFFDKSGLSGAAVGNEGWGQQKGFNDLQKNAQDAAKASAAFDRLGISSESLTGIITGSISVFSDFKKTLQESGDGGNEAAAKLQAMRDAFTGMQTDFQRAGPGAALLAEGIAKIAGAAGDADTKLTGMKLALEGLGLDQTSQYENAIQLAEAVQGLATAAQNAVDSSQPLGDLWGPDGKLAVGTSANARNLFNQLSPAIEAFKRSVAGGADVGGAFKQITDQIPALAQAFTPVGGSVDDTTAKINNLISSLGGLPDTVKLLVQLEGKDVVTQDLAAIYLELQSRIGQGVEIPVKVQDPRTVEKKLDEALGPILDDYTTSTDNLLIIKPGIDPSALNTIKTLLAAQGISVGGTPVTPATLPVAPAAPGAENRTSRPAAPPPGVPPPAPAAAPAAAPQTAAVTGAVNDLNKAAPGGKVEFTITAKGYEETIAVVNQVTGAIQQMIDKTNQIPGAFQSATGSAAAVLTAFSGQLVNSGLKMMTDLAAGITAGTSSVTTAIEGVLKQIQDRMPHSPPKKGPLAGPNYVDSAGKAISTDFAAGIISGYPMAGKAAAGLAGTVKSSMDAANPFLGQLSKLVDFASHISDVFFKITNTFLDIAKFASDPLGQGTFFGKKLYERDPSITEADKQQRRKDNAAQNAQPGGPQSIQPGVPLDKGKASEKGLQPNATLINRVVSALFPDIKTIGGVRADALPDHPSGRALDIMVGQNKALGDQIHDFLQANAQALGVNYTIWQQKYQPAGGAASLMGDRGSPTQNHMDHVHVTVNSGGTLGNGDMLMPNLTLDAPAQKALADAAATPLANTLGDANSHLGTGALPGPDPLTQIANNTSQSNNTQDSMLTALRQNNTALDAAITTGQNPNATDEQVQNSLSTIQDVINQQGQGTDPGSKKLVDSLKGVQSGIATDQGFKEAQSPIDKAAGIAGAASSIAGDVFKVVGSTIEAIGGAKVLTDMLIRYPSNTEDIMTMIDQVQKFIQLGADIAGAVSSITGAIGSMSPAGMDMGAGAAIQGVSAIAGMVQSALETANAMIDLGQEAWHIFGSYFGSFLGMLAGGTNELQGQVKFLLDQNTNQLLAYSQDRPQIKTAHTVPGQIAGPEYAQGIGQINVYGGPGSDPRDNTRQMMFQVKAAGYGAGQPI